MTPFREFQVVNPTDFYSVIYRLISCQIQRRFSSPKLQFFMLLRKIPLLIFSPTENLKSIGQPDVRNQLHSLQSRCRTADQYTMHKHMHNFPIKCCGMRVRSDRDRLHTYHFWGSSTARHSKLRKGINGRSPIELCGQAFYLYHILRRSGYRHASSDNGPVIRHSGMTSNIEEPWNDFAIRQASRDT